MPAIDQQRKRWTAAEVRALPEDGNRYELIDGELLVTPAPRMAHQRVVQELWRTLDPYVRAHGLGEVFNLDSDLELEPESIVQPDLFVIPAEQSRRAREWSDVSSIVLAVEVLSPSTARRDRGVKRRYYQRVGVPEYWIVDVDARLVERWRPGDERPEVLAECVEWRPAGAAEPFVLELATIFAVLDPGAE